VVPPAFESLLLRIPLTSYGIREIAVGSALCVAALAVALWLWPPAAAPVLLLWGGLLSFFRDPERPSPAEPDTLLSPADGVVRDVEEVDPPGDYLPGRAVRIGIFMSVFNVHVNRSPAAGTVEWVEHTPGRYLDARNPKAATENEHNLLGLRLAGGRKVLVNQIAGTVARRIVCAVAPGRQLAAGERFGMVKFGSRVELMVPLVDQPIVAVTPGDRVRAGRDVLLRYRPENDG